MTQSGLNFGDICIVFQGVDCRRGAQSVHPQALVWIPATLAQWATSR
ncbi:hypothetical protein PA15_0321200 [Pseudomonas aeruginosa HB15]|nr:hypothetical protein PADK2_28060 [Pseudomonas aeruginosa DK2]ESQ64479.1 hypothetical protein PA15_0321200 [Pseudomonas aeruginosa HB15]KAJ12637.1 hypothetical protein M002_16330 [Pseudomonas aeruginosa ID4365]KFB21925.1 hypothetical protein PGPR2_30190 [Pseudomonas aeruginosa PGPR2]